MKATVRPRLLLPALVVLGSACSRTPPDLRQWRPSDHDRTEETSAARAAATTDGGADLGRPAKMLGVDQVVLVAWRQNCTRCHGMLGQGDGPQGAMYGARNLSDPAWQASVTDAQIATAISQGKGKMPAADLPESTVKGLVRLVRLMNADRGSQKAGPGDDGGTAVDDAGSAPTRPANAHQAAPGSKQKPHKPQ